MNEPLHLEMVLAAGLGNEIGRGNDLPWKTSPHDMQRVREVTAGRVLVMGWRTHQSVGRILPGRPNVVVTSTPRRILAGGIHATTFTDALRIASMTDLPVSVLGGVRLFAEAARHPSLARVYLTRVRARFPAADVVLPTLTLDGFRVAESLFISGEPSLMFYTIGRGPDPGDRVTIAPVDPFAESLHVTHANAGAAP